MSARAAWAEAVSSRLFGRVDEEARQVGGDPVLEADVVVAEHRQGDDDHHRAHRDLQADAAARQRGDDLAPAEHQEVEDDGRADPVGEGDREAAGGERLRGGDGDHAGEDRAGAGRVDEAEAGADRGARPEAVALAFGDSGAGSANWLIQASNRAASGGITG